MVTCRYSCCAHASSLPVPIYAVLYDVDTQVSDKERQLELDSLFKDVASVLSEKCINPDNNKPYTITMLERALKDVHFSVDLHRNAKQQALDVSTMPTCNLAQLWPQELAMPALAPRCLMATDSCHDLYLHFIIIVTAGTDYQLAARSINRQSNNSNSDNSSNSIKTSNSNISSQATA